MNLEKDRSVEQKYEVVIDYEKKIDKLKTKRDGLNETGSLLGPFQNESNPRIQKIQKDIDEMKKKISKITELLYVHDRAISELWN